MIAFVVALLDEAQGVLDKLENKKVIPFLDKICYSGSLDKKNVIIAISGIGKVSSALTTQAIIDKFNPELIINFGSCGAINNKVNVKEYCLVDKACQLDFDVSEIDDVPIGYIQEYKSVFFKTIVPNNNLKVFSLASSDKFTNNKKYIELVENSGCLLRDMEGGAIAQVCVSNKIPLIILKGITDIYGSNENDYYKNKLSVCAGFYDKIIEIISIL